MVNIGLDLGFGYLKAYGNGRSICTQAVDGIPTGNHDIKTGLSMMFEGEQYLIGETAINNGLALNSTTASDKFDSPVTRRLAGFALAYIAGSSGEFTFNIATGLPVEDYKPYKKNILSMLQSLDGKTITVNDNGKEWNTKIRTNEISVLVQGSGIIANLSLDENGNQITEDYNNVRILVTDIGHKTVNFLTFDDNLDVITRYCRNTVNGLHTVHKMLKTTDKRFAGLEDFDVDIELRRERKNKFDASPQYKQLAKVINDNIESLGTWHELYIIAGGGAHVLYEYILPGESGKKHISKDGQLAQAKGYYKMVTRKWQSKTNENI